MSGWLTSLVRLMSPSVTAAMKAIPDDSPSRPSMKLMLLIIPTIQKTVKRDRERPSNRIRPAAERVRDELDVDPEGDREQPEAELADELPARAEVEEVVEGADRRGQRAAQQEGRELASVGSGTRSRSELGVQLEEDARPRRGTPSRRRCRRRAGSVTC